MQILNNEDFINLYNSGCKNFRGANLQGIELSCMDLDGIDFSEANLCNSEFYKMNFSNIIFNKTILKKSQAEKTSFKQCIFNETDLSESILNSVEFNETKVENSSLIDSYIISGSLFLRSKLKKNDFSRSTLETIDFLETTILECNLMQATFNSINFVESSIINSNFDHKNFASIQLMEEHISNNYKTINEADLFLNIEIETNDLSLHQKEINNLEFKKLVFYLRNKQWKEADYITGKIMLRTVNREAIEFIREEEMNNFPCNILDFIDNQWIKYSNGHFGYKVQNHIWREFGGKNSFDNEIEILFGEKVGWRKSNSWISYSDINFTESVPQGHFPLSGVGCAIFCWKYWGYRNRYWLFSRINSCLS